MRSKSRKERTLERSRRRRDIRRGMKIALYEVEQMLAPHGVSLEIGPAFIPYTIAIAEGSRRDATFQDKLDAAVWSWAIRRRFTRL